MGFRIQGFGFRAQSTGYKVHGTWHGVRASGLGLAPVKEAPGLEPQPTLDAAVLSATMTSSHTTSMTSRTPYTPALCAASRSRGASLSYAITCVPAHRANAMVFPATPQNASSTTRCPRASPTAASSSSFSLCPWPMRGVRRCRWPMRGATSPYSLGFKVWGLRFKV